MRKFLNMHILPNLRPQGMPNRENPAGKFSLWGVPCWKLPAGGGSFYGGGDVYPC
jgi:hypothetical protein